MNISRYAIPAVLACAATLFVAASDTHAQVPRKPALPAADVTRPATPLQPAEADKKDTQRRVNPVNQPPAVPAGAGAQAVQNESLRARETRAQVETPQVRQPMQAVQPLPAQPRQAYIPVLETQEKPQAATSSAPAQPLRLVAVGPPHITALSGKGGGIRRTVDLYSPQRPSPFIDEIRWMEVGNRPCLLQILGVSLTSDYRASGGRVEEQEHFSCITRSVFDGQWRSLKTDEKRPVSSVGVCNNNNANLRMKGIRIEGKFIYPSDTNAVMPNVSDQESLPNCKQWGQTRSCPTNMRATGLVVHAKDAGGDNKAGITGLQLICREVAAR